MTVFKNLQKRPIFEVFQNEFQNTLLQGWGDMCFGLFPGVALGAPPQAIT